MTRRQSDPLRSLTEDERTTLERVAHAPSERVDRAGRARALVAVADGASSSDAAQVSGRRCGDSVAHLVHRFNRDGLAALDRR
ncbi:MAG: helix-turn-helix domain-containing protein [Dehalococcoidia bacterium]